MSKKGAAFGERAKRLGTLEQRREKDRRRADQRRAAAFDLDLELARFERDQMRKSSGDKI